MESKILVELTMVIRASVVQLVEELSSSDRRLIESGILHSALWLQQTNEIKSVRLACARNADKERCLAAINTRFGVFGDSGTIPKEYVGVELSVNEIEIMTRALSDLLAQDAKLARQAAMALSHTRRLDAVPALIDAVIRDMEIDGRVASAALCAIADVVIATVPAVGASSAVEQETLRTVMEVFELAAKRPKTRDASRQVAESARSGLLLIGRHFGWKKPKSALVTRRMYEG